MGIPRSDGGDSRRTVIVTGAGGGLGSAISRRLVRDGFHCVLAGRDMVKLEKTAASCLSGSEVPVPFVCNVRDPEDRRRLVGRALDQGGQLFGLVNGAGVAYACPLLDETLDDWRDSFETNLEAAYFLSQLAIKHMRPNRAGRIVNIASAYGTIAFDNRAYGPRAPDVSVGDRGPYRQTAYAASKGGLIQLTRDLAAAIGRWGITVNAISPGSIPAASPNEEQQLLSHSDRVGHPSNKPGLGDRIPPETVDLLAAQVPLGRVGEPDEVAGPVSFLLSDDATYVTGVNLAVDGGWTIW